MIARCLPGPRIEDLRDFDLLYVGTPYTRYRGGIEAAFREACKVTARLVAAGVNVYSPIAHTHPIAIHGGLDPLDLTLWLDFDAAMMMKADGMIVARLDGWKESSGVRHEIEVFQTAGKPVFHLDCTTLEVIAQEFA